MAGKRLGEILLEAGVVTSGAVEQALVQQVSEGGRIGEILQKARAVSEEDVLRALGTQLGIPFSAELDVKQIDADLASLVPIAFAKQHRLLPIRKVGTTVTVATADPLDVGAFDDLRGTVGGDLDPLLVPSGKIMDAVNQVYGRKQDAGTLGEGEGDDEMGAAEELVDILDVNDEAPIIRWVNSLMFNAVKERASDIHIEPGEKDVIVRYRIDGVLYETRRAARSSFPRSSRA